MEKLLDLTYSGQLDDWNQRCREAFDEVNWSQYATVMLPQADFLSVPCRFPDLRDDRELKGAIHFTLRKQLSSLQSQRTAGVVVLQLLRLCQQLLEKVFDTPAVQPTPKD